MIISVLFSLLQLLNACNTSTPANEEVQTSNQYTDIAIDASAIHVYVPLCDNKYQGIVPVGSKIGNGQDPFNNLYWGCAYGVKTFFSRSKDWKRIRSSKVDSLILERVVFRHRDGHYLVADAYNGKYIKACTEDFLMACAGRNKDTIQVENKVVGVSGYAKLIAFTGHDGLMDFELDHEISSVDSIKRKAIILACYSKNYFAPKLREAGAEPLVWTTGLMSPEAYTLHAAVEGYIHKESNASIVKRAAQAYAKYQKCSLKAAQNLLVTGW